MFIYTDGDKTGGYGETKRVNERLCRTYIYKAGHVWKFGGWPAKLPVLGCVVSRALGLCLVSVPRGPFSLVLSVLVPLFFGGVVGSFEGLASIGFGSVVPVLLLVKVPLCSVGGFWSTFFLVSVSWFFVQVTGS